jgi:hypothetical protein
LIVTPPIVSRLGIAVAQASHIMKRISLAVILVVFCSSGAWAGQPDPRFEGVWVGSETYTVNVSGTQLPEPPTHATALIAIAQGGKEFGVLQGLGPGKYPTSPQSGGNKLLFKSNLTGTGRTSCTLMLSPDGTTITETGFGVMAGKPHAKECSINGTFHRKGAK